MDARVAALALLGAALAKRTSFLSLLLALPWAKTSLPWYGPGKRNLVFRLRQAPRRLAIDATEMAVLARGQPAPPRAAAVTRVAFVTPTYWPEVRRGTERFAHVLGVGLTQRGDDVTIVTSHRGRPATATEGRAARDPQLGAPCPTVSPAPANVLRPTT